MKWDRLHFKLRAAKRFKDIVEVSFQPCNHSSYQRDGIYRERISNIYLRKSSYNTKRIDINVHFIADSF